jgi:hypothetical protein
MFDTSISSKFLSAHSEISVLAGVLGFTRASSEWLLIGP